MGQITTNVTIDDENDADCEIEYTYKKGSSDYFSGGCWNPGDPPEIEVDEIISDGKKIRFDDLNAHAQEQIYEAIEKQEAAAEYEGPDYDG